MATTTDGAPSYLPVSRLVARRCLPVFALLLGGCFSPNMSADSDEAMTEDGTGGASMTTMGDPGASTGAANTSETTTGMTTGMETAAGSDPSEATESGPSSEPTTGGEDPSASDSGSESSNDETSSAAECMGECVDLGANWHGPVTLLEGDTPPSCADEASPAFTAFSGLNAPAADCGCSCGSPDIACPESGTISSHGDPSDVSCGFVTPVWQMDVGPGCNDIPNALEPTTVRLRVDQPANLDAASCAPSASTEIVPATWDSAWAGCGADAAAGDCDVCSTNTQDMCIWQEGDVECDVPGFSEKTLLATDFAEGRECSECSCGDVGGSCSANVTYRALDGCTLANVGEAEPGDCLDVEFARGADVEFTAGSLACGAAEVSPIGSATPTDPITACCAG